jgi:trk system potassium uptake protein
MRALVRASGVVAAGGPLLSLLGPYLHPGWLEIHLASDPARAWPVWLLWCSSLLVTLGGMVLRRARDLGRNLVVAGLGLWAIQAVMPALRSPGLVLGGLSAIALVLHLLFPAVKLSARHVQDALATGAMERARAAAATSLAGWPLVWIGGIALDTGVVIAQGSSLVIASMLILRASARPRVRRWMRVLLVAATGAAIAGIALVGFRAIPTLFFLSLVPIAGVLFIRTSESRLGAMLVDVVASHPARLLAVTFLVLCATGAVLLRLPVASAADHAIAGVDAVFTATSAVCVTGLIVLDTPNDFSFVGQLVIMVLIQLGGLGIMSFSTAAIAALGRRLSLRHEAAMAELLSGDRSDMFGAIRRLLGVTFVSEGLGAIALWGLFRAQGDPVGVALWRGVFTSISAFCNAGFALQSDSLMPYAESPAIINVVAALILLGGLSPAVVVALPNLLRGRDLPLQVRMVLITSAGLLALGFVLLIGLEWSHSFGSLPWAHRVDAAWFQSVTLRTAGFNSVDFAALQPATLWVMLAFMFVGGSPGGTAGGVKTTTLAVLLLAVRGAWRGQWEATAFGRKLSKQTFYEAATIVTVAAIFVFAGVTAIAVTQAIPLEQTLFEVVSALGTVGLSVGATGMLDDVGKLIVVVCMFIGRIGPLTLFMFLRERQAQVTWKLPETEVDVG